MNKHVYVETEVKTIPSKHRLEAFVKQINAEILLCIRILVEQQEFLYF